MSFPTDIPSYPDTQGNETLATAGGGVGLSGILDVYGVDITAAVTKIGTAASTPAAGKILIGTGAGTSEWGTVVDSLTFTGIPYIQGANGVIAITADTDGGEYNFSVDTTGTLVFYGSAGATLNVKLLDGTLSVDTIAETTAANGVTVDGLNIKDSKLNTNDSVVTANITNDAVTDDKLDYPRWWQEIARTTLSGTADVITVSSIPARKYLMFIFYGNATGGTLNSTITFNNDTGSNYVVTYSAGFGAATPVVAAANFPFESGDTDSGGIQSGKLEVIANISAEEKNFTWNTLSQDAAGTGAQITQLMGFGKWVNTSAQITRIDWTNSSGTGDFAIGSEVVVLGHD